MPDFFKFALDRIRQSVYNKQRRPGKTPTTNQNLGDLHSGSAVDSDSICGSSILSSPTKRLRSIGRSFFVVTFLKKSNQKTFHLVPPTAGASPGPAGGEVLFPFSGSRPAARYSFPCSYPRSGGFFFLSNKRGWGLWWQKVGLYFYTFIFHLIPPPTHRCAPAACGGAPLLGGSVPQTAPPGFALRGPCSCGNAKRRRSSYKFRAPPGRARRAGGPLTGGGWDSMKNKGTEKAA